MSLAVNFSLQRNDFLLRAAFELPARGITGVSGVSGSGKTSLLRAIAGLESVDGDIRWQHQSWQALPPNLRPVGYVFQEPRLFPHLSVRDNLRFAAKRAVNPLPLDELVETFGLNALLERKPQQLSGGQAQRAAIARALIQRPALLLLDEPLANLDRHAKRELLEHIALAAQQLAMPMLYVSHSSEELAQVAEQILFVERRANTASAERMLPIQLALTAADSPLALQADAISVLQAQVQGYDAEFELCELRLGNQPWWLAHQPLPPGSQLRLQVHARDVSISLEALNASSIQNRLQARVISIHPEANGPHCTVVLCVEGQRLLARITRRAQSQLQLQPQQIVYAQVKAAALA